MTLASRRHPGKIPCLCLLFVLSSPSLNFHLLLSPPRRLLLLHTPPSPPPLLPCTSMSSILSLAPCPLPIPLSLPSYLSSSAWTFRIFLGRNQCKCCHPPSLLTSSHLEPFYFHLDPSCIYFSGRRLSPSSPLPPPHSPRVTFTVDLCVGSCTVVLHGCEHNQRAPLTGALLKHSNLSKLQILSFVLTRHLLHHFPSPLTPLLSEHTLP